MSFIHFMSFKLIKTTQKCLIFCNLLGVLINKVLIKNSKFILHSLHFLKIFKNHPKIFFRFIKQFLYIKVLIKKLKQELNVSIYFRDYKLGQALGTTNRGKRDYKQTQLIGTGIRNRGKRDCKPGQEFQIGVKITNRCRTLVILTPILYIISLIL